MRENEVKKVGHSTFGVILLPDEKTEISVRMLAQQESGNLLPPKCHVHLSLFHAVLEESQLVQAWEFISALPAPKTISIFCREILRKNGWRFVEVNRSRQLLSLQRAILPIAHLRAEDTPFEWRSHATENQLNAFERYGYPNVGIAWFPHFTFGKVNCTEPELAHTPFAQKGMIRAIGLGVIGEYGTLTEVLEIKDLST